ncbi:unnamed protein product [Amaranthus hypochondriacus]
MLVMSKEIEDGVVISSEPGKDALSNALGKPDNYGYVIGISRFCVGVGHRKVFGKLPRKGIISNRDEEIEELKATIMRMESRFETTLQQKVAEEVKSYIASLSSLNIPPILEEPKICRLAVEDDDGNLLVVADGTVHPCDDGVVHSSKLLPDHYKVSIDNPYEEHKLVTLPVPSPDGETELGKSKGYFVQWPIYMVVFDEMDNALKTLSQSKEQVGSCDPYRSQESGAGLDNQLALFDVGDLDMDTSEIALLKMIMLEENPDTITVPIKAPLLYYQENKDIWVTSNDISEMMNGAWLNVSIFHVYILLIEDLWDKGQGERITFLCPQIISGDECKRDFFGCAQQPGGRECGYYVMRFMYEIVKQYSQCMGDLQQEYIARSSTYSQDKID